MASENDNEINKRLNKLLLVFRYFIHVLIFFTLVRLLQISIFYYKHLLSWHAMLESIAVVLLMSESIMSFSNSWNNSISRRTKIWVHGILFTLATASILIGVICEFKRKDDKHYVHFNSVHSILGLFTTVLSFLTCTSGLSTANFNWISNKITNVKPVIAKLSHNSLGHITYLIGIITLCSGLYTKWIISSITIAERIVLILVLLSIAIWVLFNAFRNLLSQINSVRGNSDVITVQC